jgi:CHAT domain-containing protein
MRLNIEANVRFRIVGLQTPIFASQWQIHSKTSQKIVTDTFVHLKNEPQLRRAEALQKSMLGLINHAPCNNLVCRASKWLEPFFPSLAVDNPYSHPMFWAPFTVIGEGGVVQNQVN